MLGSLSIFMANYIDIYRRSRIYGAKMHLKDIYCENITCLKSFYTREETYIYSIENIWFII